MRYRRSICEYGKTAVKVSEETIALSGSACVRACVISNIKDYAPSTKVHGGKHMRADLLPFRDQMDFGEDNGKAKGSTSQPPPFGSNLLRLGGRRNLPGREGPSRVGQGLGEVRESRKGPAEWARPW